MPRLRDKVPVRRLVTSRRPTKDWAKHKSDLQTDFNNHCGYCDSYDGFKHTYYEVDHFVPKDFITKNAWGISLVEYSNLVYSCKFCNNNKLNIWPSNSPTVYNRRSKGFVDPCNGIYDSHFYRSRSGEIRWSTPLGKWMYSEAFKFDERALGIKLLWNLNRVRKSLLKLHQEALKYGITSRKYIAIQRQIAILNAEYVPTHRELMDYYNKL